MFADRQFVLCSTLNTWSPASTDVSIVHDERGHADGDQEEPNSVQIYVIAPNRLLVRERVHNKRNVERKAAYGESPT